jgi:hypothetical protein
VYWEFEVGGIKYKTIVQAKDWASAVKQEQLFAFKTVLDDIQGQPRGIFVTRTGYQKGAHEFAEKNGIELFELREPTAKDQTDWIKRIHLHIDISTPSFRIVKLELDEKAYPIHLTLSDSSRLFDKNGVEINTMQSLCNSLVTEGNEPVKVPYTFDKLTFIETKDHNIPRAKIKGFEVLITKKLASFEHEFVAPDFVGYVLKNVIEGTERTIPKK